MVVGMWLGLMNGGHSSIFTASKGLTTFAPLTDRACLNAFPSSTPSVHWHHEICLRSAVPGAIAFAALQASKRLDHRFGGRYEWTGRPI